MMPVSRQRRRAGDPEAGFVMLMVFVMAAVLAIFALGAVRSNGAGATGTTKVIYSFAGDEDGEYPDTELVRDGAGNLYGTTVQGGDFGGGTVFELTPSGTHTAVWAMPVIMVAPSLGSGD